MTVLDEAVAEHEQQNGANLFTRVGDFAVRTFHIGLGSVGLVQDELRKLWEESGSFVHRLEERGASMSHSGRERLDQERENINSQFETRQEQVKELGTKANESIEKAGGAVLTRANIPTAEEIQSLSKQISALNRKVDKLRQEQKALVVETAPKEEPTANVGDSNGSA